MSTDVSTWGDAATILAAAGVDDDRSFYGPFTSPAERAALTIPQLVKAAWAANDADRFADIFTENGSELIGDDQMTSREEIRSYMAEGFAGVYQGSRVVGWPLAVRFLTDDVAMAVTEGGVLIAGETQLAPERRLRSIWVIVKQGDSRLRLLSHQSSMMQ